MNQPLSNLLGDADIYRMLTGAQPPSVSEAARRERQLLRDLRNCRRPLHCRLRPSAMAGARVTAETWLATDHIPRLPPPGPTDDRVYADNWHCRDTARNLAHEGIPYNGHDIASAVARLRIAYYRCPPEHAKPSDHAVALAVCTQAMYERELRAWDNDGRSGPQPAFASF